MSKQATLAEIKRFFHTGNPERDGSKAFVTEWKALSEAEQDEFKTLVGAEING